MTERVKGRRTYDSSRRKQQARETQLQVIVAAQELFVAQGYGHTSIAEIARSAGVSRELIYAAFGTKADLLHRVWDITIGGDDEEIAFHERPEVAAMRAEPDLATRLKMHSRFFTKTARRITPFLMMLRGAEGSEPVARQMLQEIGRQRLVGMTVMAREAAATGQLAVTEDQCRDLMWSMTDGILWHRLVVERGWSDDEYARWMATMWVAALVERG